jgi:hypothetical protein
VGKEAEVLKEILETWPEYDPTKQLLSLYRVQEDSWVENHQN